MSSPVETLESHVVVYKNPKAYEKDAPKLAKKGWKVESVTERKPRAGIGRLLSLGFVTMIFPPKPELVVTYSKSTLKKGYVRCFSCGTINRDERGNKTQTCTKCGVQLAA